jgi:hypothetical protein
MIGSEKPPASGAARSSLVRSAREGAMKVVAALLLAAAFVLTGAPTATAAPAFTESYTPSSFDPAPPCRLDRPGVCPPAARSNEQAAVNQTQAGETASGEVGRNAD